MTTAETAAFAPISQPVDRTATFQFAPRPDRPAEMPRPDIQIEIPTTEDMSVLQQDNFCAFHTAVKGLDDIEDQIREAGDEDENSPLNEQRAVAQSIYSVALTAVLESIPGGQELIDAQDDFTDAMRRDLRYFIDDVSLDVVGDIDDGVDTTALSAQDVSNIWYLSRMADSNNYDESLHQVVNMPQVGDFLLGQTEVRGYQRLTTILLSLPPEQQEFVQSARSYMQELASNEELRGMPERILSDWEEQHPLPPQEGEELLLSNMLMDVANDTAVDALRPGDMTIVTAAAGLRINAGALTERQQIQLTELVERLQETSYADEAAQEVMRVLNMVAELPENTGAKTSEARARQEAAQINTDQDIRDIAVIINAQPVAGQGLWNQEVNYRQAILRFGQRVDTHLVPDVIYGVRAVREAYEAFTQTMVQELGDEWRGEVDAYNTFVPSGALAANLTEEQAAIQADYFRLINNTANTRSQVGEAYLRFVTEAARAIDALQNNHAVVFDASIPIPGITRVYEQLDMTGENYTEQTRLSLATYAQQQEGLSLVIEGDSVIITAQMVQTLNRVGENPDATRLQNVHDEVTYMLAQTMEGLPDYIASQQINGLMYTDAGDLARALQEFVNTGDLDAATDTIMDNLNISVLNLPDVTVDDVRNMIQRQLSMFDFAYDYLQARGYTAQGEPGQLDPQLTSLAGRVLTMHVEPPQPTQSFEPAGQSLSEPLQPTLPHHPDQPGSIVTPGADEINFDVEGPHGQTELIEANEHRQAAVQSELENIARWDAEDGLNLSTPSVDIYNIQVLYDRFVRLNGLGRMTAGYRFPPDLQERIDAQRANHERTINAIQAIHDTILPRILGYESVALIPRSLQHAYHNLSLTLARTTNTKSTRLNIASTATEDRQLLLNRYRDFQQRAQEYREERFNARERGLLDRMGFFVESTWRRANFPFERFMLRYRQQVLQSPHHLYAEDYSSVYTGANDRLRYAYHAVTPSRNFTDLEAISAPTAEATLQIVPLNELANSLRATARPQDRVELFNSLINTDSIDMEVALNIDVYTVLGNRPVGEQFAWLDSVLRGDTQDYRTQNYSGQLHSVIQNGPIANEGGGRWDAWWAKSGIMVLTTENHPLTPNAQPSQFSFSNEMVCVLIPRDLYTDQVRDYFSQYTSKRVQIIPVDYDARNIADVLAQFRVEAMAWKDRQSPMGDQPAIQVSHPGSAQEYVSYFDDPAQAPQVTFVQSTPHTQIHFADEYLGTIGLIGAQQTANSGGLPRLATQVGADMYAQYFVQAELEMPVIEVWDTLHRLPGEINKAMADYVAAEQERQLRGHWPNIPSTAKGKEQKPPKVTLPNPTATIAQRAILHGREVVVVQRRGTDMVYKLTADGVLHPLTATAQIALDVAEGKISRHQSDELMGMIGEITTPDELNRLMLQQALEAARKGLPKLRALGELYQTSIRNRLSVVATIEGLIHDIEANGDNITGDEYKRYVFLLPEYIRMLPTYASFAFGRVGQGMTNQEFIEPVRPGDTIIITSGNVPPSVVAWASGQYRETPTQMASAISERSQLALLEYRRKREAQKNARKREIEARIAQNQRGRLPRIIKRNLPQARGLQKQLSTISRPLEPVATPECAVITMQITPRSQEGVFFNDLQTEQNPAERARLEAGIRATERHLQQERALERRAEDIIDQIEQRFDYFDQWIGRRLDIFTRRLDNELRSRNIQVDDVTTGDIERLATNIFPANLVARDDFRDFLRENL